MQKIIICILFSALSAFSFGQLSPFFVASDTLTYSKRVGGERMDSLDMYFTGNQQTNPGGAYYHIFGAMQSDYLSILERLSSPFLTEKKLTRTFSALPHLGFMYSFGAKGTQFLHTDFQQQLGSKTSLQFLLEQNSLGEMLRNGDFNNRNVQAQLLHTGKRYRFGLDLWFQSSDLSLNNGLVDTVSANEFSLEFLAVNNNEAFSETRQFRMATQHLYDFVKDSSRLFGILYKNQWSIAHREFRDSLDMLNKYSQFNFDSIRTRDQHQIASFQNALGLAFERKNFTLETYAQLRYWDFQNISSHLDTSELSLHGNLIFSKNNWHLKNEAYFNLMGALGEWSEKLIFFYRKNNMKIASLLSLESKLPDAFQRRYFANSYSWKLNELKTQQTVTADIGVSFQNRFNPAFKASFQSFSNKYYFLGNTWRNDTLSQVNLLQLTGEASIPLKSFGIKLRASVNPLSADFAYIPLWDLRSRVYFQKKLFKAKKFDFICAFDVKYQSTYQLLQYDDPLGIYVLNQNALVQHKVDWLELDFYTGFQIDEFRFYLKLENLEYSWLNRDLRIAVSYPMAPTMFRLGLTWDFFN